MHARLRSPLYKFCVLVDNICMLRALKTFGQGILWAVLLPFILVGIAVVGVFGIADFLIEFVIMIINFFRGKKLFPIYPEDQKAYDILKRAIDKQNGELETPVAPQPQSVYVQQNFYSAPPQSPFPMPPSGSLPQGNPQMQIPPTYVQGQIPPGYPQQQLPPAYQQPQPQQLPPVVDEPVRPELATLPTFDASLHGKTDSIEIDIHSEDDNR